ncbi:MAG TPA: cupin domain-containing protein [Candidatus Acidoferrales bacterium]|nr:cupin domain-containing protein [Candidatus Acidoferrales bacterium]
MRARLTSLFFVAALVAVPAAAGTSGAPTVITPSQLKWVANNHLGPGARMAVLAGDPSKAGFYTIRVMIPDGISFPPHFSDGTEYITVLQGAYLLGLGDDANGRTMTLTPGTFAVMPAGVHHFARGRGVTILQVTGMGPMKVTMVKVP